MPLSRACLSEIQKLYGQNRFIREIFDQILVEGSHNQVTTIDWAVKLSSDAHRLDYVHAFKELDYAGLGTYKPGRRGRPTRFEWTVSALEAAHATMAQSMKLYEITLRPDVTFMIQLPDDLTEEEARHLSDFLMSVASTANQ